MKNLQEIIDRYKEQIPYGSVMGFLGWGGKQYYKKDSVAPTNLNADYNGFIINKKGKVETFNLNTLETSLSKKKWGLTLSEYYPHQYFPDKSPIKIETIRIMPGVPIGTMLKPTKKNIALSMEYPEFYKPIYK